MSNLYPSDGTCCSCSYSGNDETPCLKREDKIHCVHWWEGPDEALKEAKN